MKIFVLVACLVVVVNAIDNESIRKLHENLYECKDALPKCVNQPENPMVRSDTWQCALTLLGVIDRKGKINKKKGIKYCESVIPDDYVEHCKSVVADCIDTENRKPGSNFRKTRNTLDSIILQGIMSLIPTEYFDE